MSEQNPNDPVETKAKPEVHVHLEGDSVKWFAGGLVMVVGLFLAGLYGIAKQPEGASKLEAIGTWFPWRKYKSSETELPTEPPTELE